MFWTMDQSFRPYGHSFFFLNFLLCVGVELVKNVMIRSLFFLEIVLTSPNTHP